LVVPFKFWSSKECSAMVIYKQSILYAISSLRTASNERRISHRDEAVALLVLRSFSKHQVSDYEWHVYEVWWWWTSSPTGTACRFPLFFRSVVCSISLLAAKPFPTVMLNSGVENKVGLLWKSGSSACLAFLPPPAVAPSRNLGSFGTVWKLLSYASLSQPKFLTLNTGRDLNEPFFSGTLRMGHDWSHSS
jgi:hypothetical protein